MSQILRLLIPADWPAQRTTCEWALVNASGAKLQQGCSEPRHWPAAERCELVLSAEQCMLLHAHLPKGARARTPEVVAYALEDQLIGETDAEHFVIGASVAGATEGEANATPVWVIARARLRSLLAALQALDRIPHRMISEIQLAPFSADWTICLRDGQSFARLAAENGFAFDLADIASPPTELWLALQAARKTGALPPAIAVYAAKGLAFDAATAEAWQSSLGLPVRSTGEYSWRDCSAREARNLLVGDFAPARKASDGWGILRPALLVGLVTFFVYASFSFGEWAWLDHQRSQLRQQMGDSFRATFPQVQAVVDPPLQMQRLQDQLRRERGQLGATDFLPLLAAASEAMAGQGTFHSISFEDGRLELALIMKTPEAAEALRETMMRRGLNVTLRETKPAQAGVEAIFAVRGAS